MSRQRAHKSRPRESGSKPVAAPLAPRITKRATPGGLFSGPVAALGTLWQQMMPKFIRPPVPDAAVKLPAEPQRPSRPTPPPPAARPTPLGPAPTLQPTPAPPAATQDDGLAHPPRLPLGPVTSQQDRYDALARAMLSHYGISVRKWRSGTTGVAVLLEYPDGRIRRYLESPEPKGPMSMAVFLHEVGHHAIGFRVYKPRCLEEYHAWRWSLEAMEAHGITVTDSVRYRMHLSLWYAVQKAGRRKMAKVPTELLPYVEKPTKPAKDKPRPGTKR